MDYSPAIDLKIEETIKQLKIPQKLQEDAYQEGWVAACEGKPVIDHLHQWFRGERKYRRTHILMSNKAIERLVE